MVIEKENSNEYRIYALVRTEGPDELQGGRPDNCKITSGTRGIYPRPETPPNLEPFSFVDHWMLGRAHRTNIGHWKFNNNFEFQELNLCSEWNVYQIGEMANKYTTNRPIKTLGRKGLIIGIPPI